MEPEICSHRYGSRQWQVLAWRPGKVFRAISSGPLGGGLGLRRWVLNAQVPRTYARRDPDAHLTSLAATLGLKGAGVGMLTAADVRVAQNAVDGGLRVWATVGVDLVVPAACEEAAVSEGRGAGTINVVAWVPRPMTDAALVNAVATATEAKTQALRDAGFTGTGTPTDAVCICCPDAGKPVEYAGPRSRIGASLARAVHRAVLAGARAYERGVTTDRAIPQTRRFGR